MEYQLSLGIWLRFLARGMFGPDMSVEVVRSRIVAGKMFEAGYTQSL